MTGSRSVEGQHEFLAIADPPQLYVALTILHRFNRICVIQQARGAWDFAASLGNQAQGF